MLIVHVMVKVKPDKIEDFKAITIKNASKSIREPGIIRFDCIQGQDDTTKFVLSEVYKSPEAIEAHKQTEHYAEWCEAAKDIMAEPRYSIKYTNVFPEEKNW